MRVLLLRFKLSFFVSIFGHLVNNFGLLVTMLKTHLFTIIKYLHSPKIVRCTGFFCEFCFDSILTSLLSEVFFFSVNRLPQTESSFHKWHMEDVTACLFTCIQFTELMVELVSLCLSFLIGNHKNRNL